MFPQALHYKTRASPLNLSNFKTWAPKLPKSFFENKTKGLWLVITQAEGKSLKIRQDMGDNFEAQDQAKGASIF